MCVEFTIAELEAESGELLPAREALALVNLGNITNVVAINTAVSLNVLTLGSSAYAGAGQFVSVIQR